MTLMTVLRNYSVNSQRKKVWVFIFNYCIHLAVLGLDWDEELLIKYYDQPVNYGSDSLFFNIAVKVRKAFKIRREFSNDFEFQYEKTCSKEQKAKSV